VPARLRTIDTRLLAKRMISPGTRCFDTAKLTVTSGAAAKWCVRLLVRATAIVGTAKAAAATTAMHLM
jgi:hypothetical protein